MLAIEKQRSSFQATEVCHANPSNMKPNPASISRRPRLVTPKALLSRSGTTHFRFRARSAGPRDRAATCGRAHSSPRRRTRTARSVLIASMSTPEPKRFRSNGCEVITLSAPEVLDSQASFLKRSCNETPRCPRCDRSKSVRRAVGLCSREFWRNHWQPPQRSSARQLLPHDLLNTNPLRAHGLATITCGHPGRLVARPL